MIVWRFFSFFAKPLSLFPFSFDDFIKALVYSEPVELIIEAVISLLINLGIKKAIINHSNWEGHLRRYLRDILQLRTTKPTDDEDEMNDEQQMNGESEEKWSEEVQQITMLSDLFGRMTWQRIDFDDKLRLFLFLSDETLNSSNPNSLLRFSLDFFFFFF
jgi:hypothetical protein